jgi:uncharacterized protein (DUF362 family)
MMAVTKSRVVLARTDDRAAGVQQTIRALAVNPAKNKDVLIKPNFNTADPAPGSTHNDTLVALVDELWQIGARSISVGERSYPRTASVMEAKGIVPLLEARDVRIIDFDALPDEDWVKVDAAGSHWRDGFRVARPVLEADCLVSTGCLKTHQFGGVFTLSLKLHVGVVPTTRHGYDYMAELHGSPYQQELIAEINAPFAPDLVVMDGVEVFVDGGPATGKRVRGDVVLAATDRVAIDAVGVAILKQLGSNAQVMTRPIFAQKQIVRAVELGLGADSPEAIELMATDPSGEDFRDRVAAILSQG